MFEAIAAQPTTRTNLKDVVAETVRTKIFAGTLAPGSRIDQDQLAEELGVSRLPVREALIALEQEGWVTSVPRQGAYVAVLTPNDVLDHYRIFGNVCALAAERAAAELTSQQLKTLASLAKAMKGNSTDAEKEQLNHQFHSIINRAGGSARLLAAIRTLAIGIPARFFEFNSGWNHEIACRQHDQIVKALRQRDGELAAKLVLQHLTDGGEFAVQQLGSSGFWDRSLRVGV